MGLWVSLEIFVVNPIPNSWSVSLETVNYYVYGNDSAVTADQTVNSPILTQTSHSGHIWALGCIVTIAVYVWFLVMLPKVNPLPTIGNSLKKQKSLYKVLTPSIKPPI